MVEPWETFMLKPDRRDFLKLSGMAGVATTLKFAVGRGAWQCTPSPGQSTLKFPTSPPFIGNKCTPDPVVSTAALRRHESEIFGCCGPMAIPNCAFSTGRSGSCTG
jgi:hypothetical protein